MEEDFREQPLEEPANVSGETINDSAASVNGSLTQAEGEVFLQEDKDFAPESEEKKEDEDLGKFKSVQSLLTAYNNLQASYTKKCQRLSELEKDKTIEEKPQLDKNLTEEQFDQFLSENIEAQNKMVDKYVLSNQDVKNKIIQDYLQSLNKLSPPIVISGQGQRVSGTNTGTPSSMSEAKAMMENMFK